MRQQLNLDEEHPSKITGDLLLWKVVCVSSFLIGVSAAAIGLLAYFGKPNGECKAASQLSCSNISQTPESNILSLKKLDSIDNKTKILETWVQSAEKSITSFENKIQELYSVCPDPTILAHQFISPSGRPFVPGTNLTYTCDVGYDLEGESLRQCLPGQMWSTSSAPTCHNRCLRKRQFNFPNANQTTDYAYYNSTLSNMPESTVCFWAEMSSTPNNTCLLSYAVSGENNELSVFYSAGKIKTFYSGQEKTWRASFSHSHNQICMAFSSSKNQSIFFLNGVKTENARIDIPSLEGGGHLVLGQDQDAYSKTRPGFQSNQAFRGNIANVIIWPRVLTTLEIEQLAKGCKCPTDYAVFLDEENTNLHGNATFNNSRWFCLFG